MTFHADKPVGTDDIVTALTTYAEQSLEHLKGAINQEHGWDDDDATASVHDEGVGRVFVNTWENRQTSGWLKGRMFVCTDHGKVYHDDGTQWVETDLSGSVLLLSGGTMTGAIAMGTNKITGLGTPTASTDACSKSYADSIVGAGGLHADTHTDGTDDIQSSTDEQKGVMTAADHTILSNLNNTYSKASLIHSLYPDDDNPPSQTKVNDQPALAFAAAADDIGYLEPIIVPNGATSAKINFRYNMSTAVADKNISINWTPRVNGVVKDNVETEIATTEDTDEHSYTGADLTQASLTAGNILGGKFYRDVDGVASNHTGNFQLILIWIVWS